MVTEVPDLGDLERDVMELVWKHGPVTADTVREALPRNSKDSTVRTVLKRLERKGLVSHTVEGRTYLFKASIPRKTLAARAVKRIVDRFCQGSVDDVLVGMADAKMLDRDQLAALIERLDQEEKP
ncbi:CopY family transcriptional regulator [Gluconacetobacter sacchari DSM 12717]|uniref:BlaI/MecI/CopY family transcriptional regulator n=2 Tax=Gluconacetobacter sacchari TaxID=92759 RepID=A0A7W4NNW7_9PROT|nr:BlaI/MecI/CopY family transcriptional regulator [Gluconacetobacter sacchari]MBB2158743.1 BlaI/MecI/CopY family transcriptional regulator [Gluconacetobacter sacchari]GBQ24208.1 CopY family transcriptional regulator [Gluconacetobacter sacchari DSM 12717]